MFTNALARVARDKGVEFKFNTRIRRLVRDGDSISHVETDKGDFTADAYVLCLGVNSPDLVKPLGMDLPIYPVRGYSVTVPVTDKAAAPRMGGIDEDNLLAYCPMGDRLRITATAEIAGYDRRFKPRDFKVMLDRAQALFGHCADFTKPKYWVGLRPMTPNGIPVVDRSPIGNLWLNVGHGHMGWTMASGCAAITADIIAGRTPNHDIGGLTYGHG